MIVNKRNKNTRLLTAILNRTRDAGITGEVRFANDIKADLICTVANPSMAIVVHDLIGMRAEENALSIINSIDSLQRTFKNSYCLMVSSREIDSSEKWELYDLVQNGAKGGSCRIMFVSTQAEVAPTIATILSHFNDSSKKQIQKDYFEKEFHLLTSDAMSRKVATEILQRLGCSRQDVHTLIHCTPQLTLAQIMSCNKQFKASRGAEPVSEETLMRINSFFTANANAQLPH